MLCTFRLNLGGKTGKEIPESSGLEFLEKLLANSFALSDAEDNTCWLLNRGCLANLPFSNYYQFAKSPESQISGK